MQDIAKKAGVTKATVSMVVNNDHRITEATRQKVLKVVKELRYYPNESARKLAKGKADAIAFLVPRFGAPFIANIMDAFERRADQARKYVHGIHPYATHNEIATLEEILSKILFGRKADAVVLLTQKPSAEIVLEFQKSKVPMILIENSMLGAHSIRVNNLNGAYLATKHLTQRGRKNIGLIVGELNPEKGIGQNPATLERFQGFEKALKENGLEVKKQQFATVKEYEYEEGIASLSFLLENNPGLDSVFCAAGDVVAMGVMEEAKKRGISIPRDLALIGYDDMLAARLLDPALTTVRQSFGEIASLAFDMAVGAIEGKLKKEEHVLLEPQLIIRESA
jgi:DNA-binding LacI/PurR family transcriptional regulator